MEISRVHVHGVVGDSGRMRMGGQCKGHELA